MKTNSSMALDPPVSESQRRWANANKNKIPAAKEFAESDPGGRLPEKKVGDGKGYRHGKDEDNRVFNRGKSFDSQNALIRGARTGSKRY